MNTAVGRIGVLTGGFSSEREISLKSGAAVIKALENLGYTVMVIDFHSVEELVEKLKADNFDCIFNALHGKFGEDGQVQSILDGLRIPFTGSGVSASRLAMDKVASREIFKKQGLFVPEFRVLRKKVLDDDKFYESFPLVVKPSREGSSIGLSIVENKGDLKTAIEQAAVFDSDIIVEKHIKGRELTVGILNDEPLPIIEIIPHNRFYDFQAKYTSGLTEYIVPAELPQSIYATVQQHALKAHLAIGCCCFSRIDLILSSENLPLILELNTIPGLTLTSLLPKAAAACGIDFPELCQKMVFFALNKKFEKVYS